MSIAKRKLEELEAKALRKVGNCDICGTPVPACEKDSLPHCARCEAKIEEAQADD